MQVGGVGRASEQVRVPLTLKPLGDTGLVTEAEPSPAFRRFPWIQLVCCISCLSMTAWTWMRYSYGWDVPAENLSVKSADGCGNPYAGCFVRLYGAMGIAARGHYYCLAVPYNVDGLARGNTGNYESVRLRPYGFGRAPSGPVTLSGRLVLAGPETGQDGQNAWLELDTDVSRFTWQSVAGLVVGAMGCFIFGLYLRTWLRERRALASQPEQDMIA